MPVQRLVFFFFKLRQTLQMGSLPPLTIPSLPSEGVHLLSNVALLSVSSSDTMPAESSAKGLM